MNSELEKVLNELAQYIIYGEKNIKKAYQKQTINQLDKNLSDINKIYTKFQKIEKDNYWRMDEDEIFYRQAKYLEEFECNCVNKQNYEDSLFNYRADNTYASFSFNEFKKYFSWRTKIRKGILKEGDIRYENIYINELINKIGCKDSKDVINKLIDFWKIYREYEIYLDKIMPDVIKEFYIISDINIEFKEITEKYPIKVYNSAQDIKDIKKGIYKNKIKFLSEISSYKIENSKFLDTKYGYTLNECIELIFIKIQQKFEENGLCLQDMLVNKRETEYWWEPLRTYNLYNTLPIERTVIINGTEKYECKNGMWNRTIYTEQNKYKKVIGYILKSMEFHIREYLGYRKLKLPEKNEILQAIDEYYCSKSEQLILFKIYKLNLEEIILNQIIQYLQKERIPKLAFKKKKVEENEFEKEDKVEKVEVVFNQEEFEKLRQKSEKIQKALIIDEIEENPKETIINKIEEDTKVQENKKENIIQREQEEQQVAKTIEEIQEEPTSTEENVYKKFIHNLTNPEKEIVKTLINNQNIENKIMQIAQEQNQMLEVMISNINDKALETIGDTIIEANMEAIYEDYESEIKQVI